MANNEINGNPEAMMTFSSQLTAPDMPTSLARLGTPPNLTGLVEGIMMSLLDKAATAEVSAYLTKVTTDMVTYSTKVNTAAATYSGADIASSIELVDSAVKFAQQGVDLVKQVGGSTSQQQNPGTNPGTGPAAQQPTGTVPHHTPGNPVDLPVGDAQPRTV